MKAMMVWKDCNHVNPVQDAFWIQCRTSELDKSILPFMEDQKKQDFNKRKSYLLTTQWAEMNPELLVEQDSYCFLISRDGKSVIPTEPFYPYGGQWNSWCPFRTITPFTFGSIKDLASIQESLVNTNNFEETEVESTTLDSGDISPARFPPEIDSFIESVKWTYAKTMPLWPHHYIVRNQSNSGLFVSLVKHIREHGYKGKFYAREVTYYNQDDLVYWTMGSPVEETTIVNRTRKEDTYEYRLLHGCLPD